MAARWSSETSKEKSFLLLASAITTPMMSASGLVMPAWKRGFWLRMAARSVVPARGSPEMKWNLRADFATWGAGISGAIVWSGDADCIKAWARASWTLDSDRHALGWNVPSAHLDDRRRCTRRGET